MVQTVEALFDGTVLRPDTPLPLEANTRVRITVETLPAEEQRPRSFLRTARSLKLEGPADWSANLEQYLHRDEPGVPCAWIIAEAKDWEECDPQLHAGEI